MRATSEQHLFANLSGFHSKGSLYYIHPLKAVVGLSLRTGKCYGFNINRWAGHLRKIEEAPECPNICIQWFCGVVSVFQYFIWAVVQFLKK